MNNERITIGRDSRCDIVIDARWDTVSNQHADIERRGDCLIFYDHSSNGTIINNQKIHNRDIGIYPGDRIFLAGIFELEWNVINSYFPHVQRPTVARNIYGEDKPKMGRNTIPFAAPDHNNDRSGDGHKIEESGKDSYRQKYKKGYKRSDDYGQVRTYTQAEIDRRIAQWNWGAFFCNWIWAVAHKKYAFLAIPLVTLIPYIGQFCLLCSCVYLGLKGSQIAWKSGIYKDFESYIHAQKIWTIAGLVWFIFYLIAVAYFLYRILSII